MSSVSIKDARMKADGPRLDGAATSATLLQHMRRTGPAPRNPKRPREFWVGNWGLYPGAGGAGGARTRKRRISRVRGNRGAEHLRATKRWAVANSASLGFSCPGFSCPQGTHNVPERRQEPGGLPRRRNQARSHRISRFDLGAR